MKRIPQIIQAFLIGVLLSACSVNAVQITPTHSYAMITNQPTITALPTSTATKAPSPTATKTAQPSPTPLPVITWGDTIPQPLSLPGTDWIWSPTKNELAGMLEANFSAWSVLGHLALSTAPDFTPVRIDPSHPEPDQHLINWEKNGETLFFSNGDVYAGFWSVQIESGEITQILSEIYNWPSFIYQPDAETIMFSAYSGGGHISLLPVHLPSNTLLFNETVFGDIYAKTGENFLVVKDCEIYCTTCVLTDTVDFSRYEYMDCRQEQGFMKRFPRSDEFYPQEIDTLFQDWKPASNQIVILVQNNVGENMQSGLVYWDVVTDTVTPLMRGGAWARFSPDGKTLVVLQYDLSAAEEAEQIHNTAYALIDPTKKPQLKVLNPSTLETRISLEVAPSFYEDERNFKTRIEPRGFTFSPDGRYFTVFTTETSNENQPDNQQAFLNLLETQTGQTIIRLPASNLYVIWSPDGDKLLYLEENNNWQIFNLTDQTTILITQDNQKLLTDPKWSFDGRYLSFSSFLGEGPRETYIIDLE